MLMGDATRIQAAGKDGVNSHLRNAKVSRNRNLKQIAMILDELDRSVSQGRVRFRAA
jgi:hypothetical protein